MLTLRKSQHNDTKVNPKKINGIVLSDISSNKRDIVFDNFLNITKRLYESSIIKEVIVKKVR